MRPACAPRLRSGARHADTGRAEFETPRHKSSWGFAVNNAEPDSSVRWIIPVTAIGFRARGEVMVTTDGDATFERASLEAIGSQVSPETMLIEKVDSEQLHNAIAALPIAYREFFYLHLEFRPHRASPSDPRARRLAGLNA